MTFALEPATADCVVVQFDTVRDLLLALAAIAIPAVSIPLIAWTARRHPSQALIRDGRRRVGVRVHRLGLLVVALSVAAIIVAFVLSAIGSLDCGHVADAISLGAVLLVVGGLLLGGGWAYAMRGTWVVLATIAVLDVWIFYVNVLIGLDEPEAVRGLLLLAFIIHGICTTVAARWSFVARDLGPTERAKAGEAGRTLAAVWVFLASYTGLTLLREESGIFDTTAGSAVIGALTLGALAVTMGSGFTKFAEAIHAKPAAPAAAEPPAEPAIPPPTTGLPGSEPADSGDDRDRPASPGAAGSRADGAGSRADSGPRPTPSP